MGGKTGHNHKPPAGLVERYAFLFQPGAPPACLLDPEGHLLAANEPFRAFMDPTPGPTPAEPVSLLDLLFEPAEREARLAELAAAAEAGSWPWSTWRLRGAGGSSLEVSLGGQVVRQGKRRYLVGFANPVPGGSQVEEALRESEEKYRSLVENSLLGVYVLQDGRFCFVNPRLAEMFGYGREELMGHPRALDLVHPEDRPLVAATIERRLKGEAVTTSYCFRVLTRPGRVIDVRVVTGRRIMYRGRPAIHGSIMDVTETKRAEEVLTESEERLKLAQSAADIGTWDWDIDSNEATCSERYFEHFGLEPDAGRQSFEDWRASVHPEDRERAVQEVQRALEGTVPYSNEYRVVWPDGSVHWLTSKGKVFRDESGRPRRMIGANIDVTESKRAEEALRQTSERLRISFEEAAIGVALLSPEGRFQQVNRSWCRMLGYTTEELLARDWQSITHPEDLKRGLDLARRLHSGEIETLKMEKRLLHKDGHTLWGRVAVSLVRDGSGRPLNLIAQVEDITESKRAEEALAESEARFRNLMEHVPGVSIQGYGCDGTVFYWNRASELVYGWSAAEALGRNLGDLIIPPDILPHFKRALELGAGLTTSGEFMPSGELLLLHKDGSLVPVYSIHTAVCLEGREPLLFCIDVDLSERKRAEEALRESEEKYRSLVENSLLGVYVIQDGLLRFVNRRGAEMLGYEREEMVGKPALGLLVPEERAAVAERLRRRLEGESNHDASAVQALTGQGEVVHLEVLGSLTTYQGRPAALATAIDTTERVRAEQALRESEEKYRRLVEHTLLGVYVIQDGLFRFVNPRGAEILGYEPGEVVGRSPLEFMHPEDAPVLARNIQRRLAGDTALQNYRLRAFRKDGQTVFLELLGALVHYDGRPAVHGTAIDVTERVRVEEALKESERRYRSLFENLSDAAFLADAASGVILDANRQAEVLVGRRREEIVGSHHTTLHPPRTVDRHVRDFQEVPTRPRPKEDEGEVLRADGEVVPVAITAATMTVGGRTVILGVFRDVTERQRAKEALERARGRIEELARQEEDRANWLATILDQLPVAVVIVDAEGEVRLANRAIEQLYGVPKDAVNPRGYGRLWHILSPDGQPLPASELAHARLLRGEPFPPAERILVRSDGSRVPIMVSAAPLREGEQTTGALVIFWDLGPQKETERRLEEAARLKDEFLSLASHELKTPVTSIKIFAELAARRPDMVQPKLLETLTRQADRLLGLINDLLDVSRLQMGRMPFQMRPLDLGALVHDLCERSAPVYERHQLVCLPPQERTEVVGDPTRLEQVFQNLLDNAAKYSPEGGTITVATYCEGSRVVVGVTDQGIGISAEHLPHVFERFYKPVHQQAVFSGLGVGLYICWEIVERHGGQIWVDSQEGRGTTFRICLPLAQKD